MEGSIRAQAKFFEIFDAIGITVLFDINDGTKGYNLITSFLKNDPSCLVKAFMEARVNRAVEDLVPISTCSLKIL